MGDVPPPDDSWRDDELVSLAQMRIEGRKSRAWAAFEILYERYRTEVYHRIYHYLVSHYLLPDHDLAQELTHEAFLQAWEALPNKNPQSPFERWIKRVGLNEARQHMRRQRRTINQDSSLVLSHPSSEDFEQSLVDAELRTRIDYVMARLTERQRMVFNMHYEQGLSLQEIAKALNLKQATIWQTFWRAKQRFKREWLKEEAKNDPPLES